ncbi:MAG TPA: ABC transporter ATP-binding protein [Candidatus Lokiarchaeia archaeon]|nr:ABC transporter ATP-binding protein [Candidatus Lokiarchaeia archaeon]
MASTAEFIQFDHISKIYKGNFLALDEVSFSIKKGEIYGYVGPNGAGKTTTMKILVGLIRDYKGAIIVDGNPIDYGQTGVHRMLGYLPQDVGFQEWRTVEHALRTFGLLSGVDKHALDKRIDDVLALVTLEGVRKKKIIYLSGGMQQKLLLAQALLHDPELLVLDEPMTGLDPMTRFHLKSIFKKLAREEGKTIFFSSHILGDVEDVCDTLAMIDHGKIVKIGIPKDLREEYRVQDIIEITYAEGTAGLNDVESVEFVEKTSMTEDGRQLIYFKKGVQDIDTSIQKVLATLVEQGCKVRNFNLVKPSLEDVYLQLVSGDSSDSGMAKPPKRRKEKRA